MEITKLNDASWLIKIDDITIVIDPVFSSSVSWTQISEQESKAHDADAYFITQGGKKHFNLPSFKYVSTNKPLFIPSGFNNKLPKFLKHTIHCLQPDQFFEFKQLKISMQSTQTKVFDSFLLKKTDCVYYTIEGKSEIILVSGAISQINRIKFTGGAKKTVALIPFGFTEGSSLLSDPLIPAQKAVEVFKTIETDFLIPFSDNKGNVLNSQILTLVRGQEFENKFIFLEPGQTKIL